mmetsp:Transcript_68194/g.215728  ORF Transcript_68194/g.215728 Transcript_68194/m.215728 type:complete len:215 (-) Transcript_68194:1362-2006(-)
MTAHAARSAPTACSTCGEPASPKNTGRSSARPCDTRSERTSRATNGMSRSLRSCAMICPTRPKPAMMTWLERSSTSDSTGCIDMVSAFSNLPATACPAAASHGVMAMESATTRKSCELMATGRIPALTASPKRTNANSPEGARYRPARADAITERPKSGPMAIMSAVLPTMSAVSWTRMDFHATAMTPMLISIPTVMKKSPRRMPRYGAMSDST